VAAFQAMKSQGIGVVYPYLGGATFAVAQQANQANIPVLTPGTDNCSLTDPKFAVSVIFDPGAYFNAALIPFKDGKLKVGTALTFHMGSTRCRRSRCASPPVIRPRHRPDHQGHRHGQDPHRPADRVERLRQVRPWLLRNRL
jgi:hypothetical protein